MMGVVILVIFAIIGSLIIYRSLRMIYYNFPVISEATISQILDIYTNTNEFIKHEYILKESKMLYMIYPRSFYSKGAVYQIFLLQYHKYIICNDYYFLKILLQNNISSNLIVASCTNAYNIDYPSSFNR